MNFKAMCKSFYTAAMKKTKRERERKQKDS